MAGTLESVAGKQVVSFELDPARAVAIADEDVLHVTVWCSGH